MDIIIVFYKELGKMPSEGTSLCTCSRLGCPQFPISPSFGRVSIADSSLSRHGEGNLERVKICVLPSPQLHQVALFPVSHEGGVPEEDMEQDNTARD